MKHTVLLTLFLITFFSVRAQVIDTIGSTPVHIDIVLDNTEVDSPWDLMWGPDQTLWYSDGRFVFRYDTASDTRHEIFSLQDGNVLGMAVHPDFNDTPWVYMVVDTSASYYAGGTLAELRRYTYSFAGDSLYAPLYILQWDHPGEHIGGRITIGTDRKVYVTTSDYADQYDQDTIGNNSGKVLRVNFDGSIPSDNPRADYTWSYGHRNPQGIVSLPDGKIISSEFGAGNDELNLILRNRDYGWPYFDGNQCVFLSDTCNSPTYNYEHAMDVDINPPSGIDYYESFAIPEFDRAILEGVLSFGGTIGGIMAYKLNSQHDAVTSKTSYLTGEYGRVRDVCVTPEGRVFFITNDRNNPEIRLLYNPAAHVSVPEEEKIKLSIFPNPSAGQFIISTTQAQIGTWEIYSLTGQVLMAGNGASKQEIIDLTGWNNGLYLLRCGAGVYKIVKE